MTPLYAIFAATRLGASMELEQSGTTLAVDAVVDIKRTALALFPQSVGRWYAELVTLVTSGTAGRASRPWP